MARLSQARCPPGSPHFGDLERETRTRWARPRPLGLRPRGQTRQHASVATQEVPAAASHSCAPGLRGRPRPPRSILCPDFHTNYYSCLSVHESIFFRDFFPRSAVLTPPIRREAPGSRARSVVTCGPPDLADPRAMPRWVRTADRIRTGHLSTTSARLFGGTSPVQPLHVFRTPDGLPEASALGGTRPVALGVLHLDLMLTRRRTRGSDEGTLFRWSSSSHARIAAGPSGKCGNGPAESPVELHSLHAGAP